MSNKENKKDILLKINNKILLNEKKVLNNTTEKKRHKTENDSIIGKLLFCFSFLMFILLFVHIFNSIMNEIELKESKQEEVYIDNKKPIKETTTIKNEDIKKLKKEIKILNELMEGNGND
jgi:hypothetical protein